MFGNDGLDALLKRPEKREEPPMWQQFFASPLKTLAETLYSLRPIQARRHPHPISIVCISDTHNSKPSVPDGDVLVHAGDLTQTGTFEELEETLEWLRLLPHAHKIVIAGNHDFVLQSKDKDRLTWGDIIYLQDKDTKIDFQNGRSINFYGNPWTRKHGNWAFQYQPHEDTWTNYSPQEVDVFVTHMPPKYHLDLDGYGENLLLNELWRIRPRLHVFGHIHGGYGQDVLTYDDFEASYEKIRRGSSGWGALLKMWYRYVVYFCSSTAVKDSIPRTILVNAAHVGGLRDNLRREAIVVYI